MSKRVLICLVGLPAAGKTTLSLCLKNTVTAYDIDHICYDQHITTVNHDEDPSAWHKARQAVNQKIINLVSLRDSQCLRNKVVLLDDNFYYRGMRKEIYHIAQQHACVFGQVVFPVSTELAVAANTARTSSSPANTIVTRETIHKMSGMIEYPSEAWERNVLLLDNLTIFNDLSLQNRVEKMLRFIDRLIELPVESDPKEEEFKREEERQRTLTNTLQQCDILLRKCISLKIKADRKSSLNIPYSIYSDSKSLLLDRLRSGAVSFDNQTISAETIDSQFSLVFKEVYDSRVSRNSKD